MKLITEQTFDVRIITEGTGTNKRRFIEGVYMQAEKKNRNGRVYPFGVLMPQVDEYIATKVKTGRALGELEHPQSPAVDLNNVSHRIVDMKVSQNDVYGKALVLNTPKGKIIQGLLEGDCKLGVSSRGMGTLSQSSDASIVNDDYLLSTVDVVHDPSAPDAFVNGIMEGVDWVWQNGILTQQVIEGYKTEIEKASSRKLVETQINAFKDFLFRISK